ncbi:MAG: hypothetical protein AAGP08_11710, partial [Pseudomonadota bacterium]
MSDTSDFKPQPFSFQNQPLTPSASAEVTALNLSASASIMTNYQPSLPVSSQHKIAAVEDVNGNPMIFSIGTENELYAIVSDPTQQTGWAQYDLTTALLADAGDPNAVVGTFEVVQLANETFALAMATTSGTAPDTMATVYVTAALSADPTASFWSNFEPEWIARPAPSSLPIANVSEFVMGPSDDASVPGVVALASSDDDHYNRYFVNAAASVTEPDDIWDE